jgi:hypothetical protein
MKRTQLGFVMPPTGHYSRLASGLRFCDSLSLACRKIASLIPCCILNSQSGSTPALGTSHNLQLS